MIDYKTLGLEMNTDKVLVKVGDNEIYVVQYLPVDEKAELVQFVVNTALDGNTGCFSPLRVDVFFAMALCKWYADVEVEDFSDMSTAYDVLESSGFISKIVAAIPKVEYSFMRDLVTETVNDIGRYNSSAAGIIQSMSNNAEGLDNQISAILKEIEQGKGLELLSEIKNVVGTD